MYKDDDIQEFTPGRTPGVPDPPPLLLGEDTLGARNRIPSSGISLRGLAQGPREGLEGSFDDMVTVLAVEHTEVQRHPRRVDQGLKKVLVQLGLVVSDTFRRELDVTRQVRAPRKVKNHLNESLIQRGCEVSEPVNASLVPESLTQR